MSIERRNRHGLTARRETFCHTIIENPQLAPNKCYQIAYPKSASWKMQSIYNNTSKLMRDERIKKRIEALQEQFTYKVPMTKSEALGVLATITRDENNNPLERMAAIRLSCDMIQGWKVNKDDDDKPAPSAVQVIIVNNHEQAKELQELQNSDGGVMKLPPPLELPVKNVAKQVAAQVKGYEVPKRKR